MRFHELIGLIDDIFVKYRKVECTPDSEWSPYAFYKNLDNVKEGYSVYVGSKGLKEELETLLHRCETEQNFKFTDKQWETIFGSLETANNQDNDDDAWTDIMFRAKYNFIEWVIQYTGAQHAHMY